MTNSKLVPKRRFKEFVSDGEWEQEKFGKIATIINGRAYSQEELLSLGKYKILRVGNFYTNESWYYSNMELDSKYYANKGDLLYTWSATFGPHIWDGDKVIYHYHIWKVELSDRTDKQYMLQLLEKDKSEILANKNGSTMVHITKEGVENKSFVFPKNIEEQIKIGNFLQQLDKSISLHQHKLDKLKDLKKAYLTEMFPAEGERMPKRRFPGFEGEWSTKELREITSLITKGTTPLDKSGEGEVNFIKVENLDASNGKILSCSKISSEEHNGYLKRSQLNENDILFSIAGTLGRIGIVESRILPANTNQALAIIRNERSNLRYLAIALKSGSVTNFILRNPTIGAQPNLSLEQVGSLEIPFPSLDEQKQIGEFFHKLDQSISLQQQKLDKLNDLKKAYMNELFV
ncbi:restriction endonuclease subunit S [Streptococcus salivarius]